MLSTAFAQGQQRQDDAQIVPEYDLVKCLKLGEHFACCVACGWSLSEIGTAATETRPYRVIFRYTRGRTRGRSMTWSMTR